MSNFNIKRVGIITLIVVILAGISFSGLKISIERQIEFSQENYQAALQELFRQTVQYIINKGEGKARIYQIASQKDSTVFSLLEELAKQEKFEIKSTIYEGMGVFVESIDGVKNGQDGKYWQYWVNDKLGEVAADKKEIKGGDKIEWRFEIPAF